MAGDAKDPQVQAEETALARSADRRPVRLLPWVYVGEGEYVRGDRVAAWEQAWEEHGEKGEWRPNSVSHRLQLMTTI